MTPSPFPQSIALADRDAKLAQALGAGNAVFLVAGPGEGAVAASKAALGPGAAEVDLGDFGNDKGDDLGAVFALRRAAQDGAPLVISGLGAGDPGSQRVQAAFEAVRQLARRGVKSVIVSRDPLESYGLGQSVPSELRVVEAAGSAIANALSQRRAQKEPPPEAPSGPQAGRP